MKSTKYYLLSLFLVIPLFSGCGGGGDDDNSDSSEDPIVQATPEPTTEPIAGGCPAINERPATGEYSGDGGCGISTAAYRSQTVDGQQIIILEPFGANGATTFNVDPNDLSSATSQRLDLVILGVPGYRCTLSCSAPSTFRVTCFKEGGVTCEEKF